MHDCVQGIRLDSVPNGVHSLWRFCTPYNVHYKVPDCTLHIRIMESASHGFSSHCMVYISLNWLILSASKVTKQPNIIYPRDYKDGICTGICNCSSTFSVGDGSMVVPVTAIGRVTVDVWDCTIERVCCIIADGVAITRRSRLAWKLEP